MSCGDDRKETDNLSIYGQFNIKKQEMKIWLIVPNTDKYGSWVWKDTAVALFTDSHAANQGVYHYSLPVNSLDFARTKQLHIQDFGNFYDNDGVNFDATLFLTYNDPKITIHALNAGIGWNGGVNLRIKDLTLNICQAWEDDDYYFSTKIQDFFNGKCYRIGGDSISGSYGLPNIGVFYSDSKDKCGYLGAHF